MIDNFSKLFEDSVNKTYINQLNQGELDKILSILDQSYEENDKENKKEDNTKTPINTQRTGVTTHRVGQDLFRRKLLTVMPPRQGKTFGSRGRDRTILERREAFCYQ